MRRLYQRETTKTTDVATFPQELPAEPPTPTILVPLPELLTLLTIATAL